MDVAPKTMACVQADVLELNQAKLSSSVASVVDGMAAAGVKLSERDSSNVDEQMDQAQQQVLASVRRAKDIRPGKR